MAALTNRGSHHTVSSLPSARRPSIELRVKPLVKTDYYRVLQVHQEADQQTIQAAYRSLSRRMHPDKNQDRGEWAERQTQGPNEA